MNRPDERESFRPVDSQTRNPAGPYRCQELREDADRVLLGRAHPQVSERYHEHRRSCASCQNFHRNMRAIYEGPTSPSFFITEEANGSDTEFLDILDRVRTDAKPESTRSRLMWLAPVAAAAALVMTTFDGGQVTQHPDEIVLEEGVQPRSSIDGTRIPDRVGAFGHHAQAFGRVLGGQASILDKDGALAAPQSFRPGAHFDVESGAPVQFALFGRVLVNLKGGALAHWTRATPELVELQLEEGQLAIHYDRNQTVPLLQIRTPSSLVRVVGTVFTVEVISPSQTIVSVLRGHVEVLDADSLIAPETMIEMTRRLAVELGLDLI